VPAVKVDTGLPMSTDPQVIVEAAKEAERQGWDGVLTAETGHDPFFPLLLAAEHTERIELGTGIAVAFARSPMIMANVGYDLQAFSRGRCILGLGSQIKAHIEKRFSMPWSHPAARMREFVLAMRAIWACWNEGEKLDFEGDFYRHTLMTPFFNPGPNKYGVPKVFLAAVGERMTEVAGEVCDGILLHGFTTERYVREVSIPALERGWAKAGKTRGQFEVTGPMFVVTGTNEEEFATARAGTKQQVAFYGSTPAYRGVLELHGWGDLQGELNRLSKQGEWEAMGELITDDILAEFAVVGEPEEIPKLMLERYGDVLDRISLYAPYRSDPDRWARVLAGFHAT
jgi:probable F420-dependent oxidoreductase